MLRRWSMIFTFSGDLKRLLGAGATIGFAYGGLQGVLMGLYLLRLGFDIEFIGLLIAAGQLLWGIFSIPAGAIGLRIGLRRAMMLGFAGTAAAFALLLLVQLLPQAMWGAWVSINYTLCWLLAALITVNVRPFVMAVSTAEERTHAFASQSLVNTISGLAGALVGGILPGIVVAIFGGSLESATPYAVALGPVSISYLVAVYLLSGTKEVMLADAPTSQDAQPAAHLAQGRVPYGFLGLLGLIIALLAIGSGAPQAFFTIYLDTEFSTPPSLIGAVMGIARFLPIVVTLITPQIVDRLGAERTLMVMGGAMALALVILGAATNWFLAAVGFAANTAIVVVITTAQNLFGQELVSAHWRSFSSAVINMGLALGWAISAALGGLLVEVLGLTGNFYLCAGIVLVASALLAAERLWRRSRPQVMLNRP